jgi:hypothetical protein
MRIDSSGNVGIGTASPSSFSNYTNVTIQGGSLGANLDFFKSNGSRTAAIVTDSSGGLIVETNTTANPIVFKTGASPSERMRIDSSGNVGIGTSSPDAPLEIEGSGGGVNLSINNVGTSGRQYILQSTSSAASIGGGRFAIYDGDASAHRFVLDSCGNVGIGTSSPSAKLHVTGNITANANSSSTYAMIRSSDTGVPSLYFGNQSDSVTASISMRHDSGNALQFNGYNNSEAMRIDSSGNLLVGKTALGVSTVGTQIESFGLGRFVRSGGETLILNRLASDGDILGFQKDGTTVGSIGTDGALNIGSTNTGIKFGTSAVWATTGGSTNSNGAKDLGASTVRWKDLYLSGGVYLGGTGSANHLDDYEEGTWTAELNIPSGSVTYNNTSGVYTKVGNIVHVSAWIYISALSSPSGTLTITMPFTNQGNVRQGQVFVQNRWTGITGLLGGWMSNSSTTLNLVQIEDGTMGSAVTGSNLLANGELYINYSYQV